LGGGAEFMDGTKAGAFTFGTNAGAFIFRETAFSPTFIDETEGVSPALA